MSIGRSGASIGVATYVNKTYWPLNTVLFARDFKGNDPRWLYYLLDSIDFSRYNSGSAQPSLNRNYLAQIAVAVPPVLEQHGIAATLGALDDKIESNRRVCSLLEGEAQAQFGLLFDVTMRDAGHAISELVSVNPLRRLTRGRSAPYIGMADLSTHTALISKWAQRRFISGQKFSNGDVLLARITPCLENGKTAYVDMLEMEEVGWGSTEFVVLHAIQPLSPPWAYCLVRTDEVRSFAIRNMSGTSGRQRFPAQAFDDYFIEHPEDDAVEMFNRIAVPSFAKMAQLRDESIRLAKLRDVLLPELLSRRIRVPEAREAVQSVS